MSAPAQTHCSARLRIQGETHPDYAQILTPDAVALVSELVERFAPQRDELLKQRVARQARIDGGELPDFLPETTHIRAGDWTVRGIPADLWEELQSNETNPLTNKAVSGQYPPGSTFKMVTGLAALEAGIAMVFQETSLVPSMTVAQNLYLGSEKFLNRLRGTYISAQQFLQSLNFPVDPAAMVETTGSVTSASPPESAPITSTLRTA